MRPNEMATNRHVEIEQNGSICLGSETKGAKRPETSKNNSHHYSQPRKVSSYIGVWAAEMIATEQRNWSISSWMSTTPTTRVKPWATDWWSLLKNLPWHECTPVKGAGGTTVHLGSPVASERSLVRLVAANSPALRSSCFGLRTAGYVWNLNLQPALWFIFLPSKPLLFCVASFLRPPTQVFFWIPVAALVERPQRRIH